MLVRFWGVRGSLPSPGPLTMEVGGNTACVEVRTAKGNLVVIDAGIGLYWLGRSLLAGPHGKGQGETSILLTRTYWDHIQGFPFFIPAFIPGNRVAVYGGRAGTKHGLEGILEGQMRPVYSPIVSLQNMGSTIEVCELETPPAPPLEIGGAVVRHEIFSHGRGVTPSVGYRIEEGGRAFAYISDVEYQGEGVPEEALRLAKGADLLVHEAFYTDDEREHAQGGLVGEGFGPAQRRGHATFGEALEVAGRAGAKRLLFSHHHPDREDRAILEAVARAKATARARGLALEVDTAREGGEVEL